MANVFIAPHVYYAVGISSFYFKLHSHSSFLQSSENYPLLIYFLTLKLTVSDFSYIQFTGKMSCLKLIRPPLIQEATVPFYPRYHPILDTQCSTEPQERKL